MRGIASVEEFYLPRRLVGVLRKLQKQSLKDLQEWKWEGRPNTRGEAIWIGASGKPMRMADGVVVCHGIITDITERKQLEHRHRESDRKYRELVEHIPLGIAIHSQGKLVYANKHSIEMMGARSRGRSCRKKCSRFPAHPDYRDVVRERMETSSFTGSKCLR